MHAAVGPLTTAAAPLFASDEPDLVYKNDRQPRGPWSIHIVRVRWRNPDFRIQSVHANNSAVGLSRLSDQVLLLNNATNEVVAGINGDFYDRRSINAGDPRGLQIVEGELISAPSGGASFWIDETGAPQATNTFPLLQVHWPDATDSAFGLNGTREANGIELYTPTYGSSTRTHRGRELILERNGDGPWLPLRAGRRYEARIREVHLTGNAPIAPDTMVLSIGPALARTGTNLKPGAELVLSTGTVPSLREARAALSGGPILVRGGRRQRIQVPDSYAYEFRSMRERHPRSAVGWNDEFFFLVQVDGRRFDSIGMTLTELAAYLVDMGCKEAINLDGGGSATLWYQGRVRNEPCDERERPVANAVLISKVRKSRRME
ncbi:MAG: phosphodiester glycosidase family protein [Verrucomicrobiota bacterium]